MTSGAGARQAELSRLYGFAILALGSARQAERAVQAAVQALAMETWTASDIVPGELPALRAAVIREVLERACRQRPVGILGQLPLSCASVRVSCLALEGNRRVLLLLHDFLHMPSEEIALHLDMDGAAQARGLESIHGQLATMLSHD